MTRKLFILARDRAVHIRPRNLLIAAACVHLLTALVIYTAARLSILPGPFIADSMGQFAIDSLKYQQDAKTLVGVLNSDGFAAWLRFPAQSHVYLYSLCFAVFSPLFGYSVLAVEPLNLLYYLASLILIYQIGKEAFGKTTGLIAAIMVGLWPSFLLHTTQVLKDPLFIVCMLALVFVCVAWLTMICLWTSAAFTVLLGVASIGVMARMKSNMWESVVVLVVVGVILLLVRQAGSRRAFVRNILSAAVVLTFSIVMPLKTTKVHLRDDSAVKAAAASEPTSSVWTPLRARIAERRRFFSLERTAHESTVDGDVVFNNTGDVIRYLPRAAVIGLFSPFPRMWFVSSSTTGRAAHFLSGAETLVFYLITLLAGVCVYVERRNLASWFLLFVALINLVALGLVVTNIGTLFRLRYVFWMLIIIMGVRGAVILAQRASRSRATL